MDNRRFFHVQTKLIRCAIVIIFVLDFAANPSSAVRNGLKHVHVVSTLRFQFQVLTHKICYRLWNSFFRSSHTNYMLHWHEIRSMAFLRNSNMNIFSQTQPKCQMWVLSINETKKFEMLDIRRGLTIECANTLRNQISKVYKMWRTR